jgi:hypothetical protein
MASISSSIASICWANGAQVYFTTVNPHRDFVVCEPEARRNVDANARHAQLRMGTYHEH